MPRFKHSLTGGGAFARCGMSKRPVFTSSIVAGYNVVHTGESKVREDNPSAMSMTVKELSFYEAAVSFYWFLLLQLLLSVV